MLKPGRHSATVSPNDACCEETTTSFVVHKAEAGTEKEPELVRVSAKFRPATVSVVGSPPGGTIVCGIGTFSASPTVVTLGRASQSETCQAIAGDLPPRSTTITVNAGRTQTIPWPP